VEIADPSPVGGRMNAADSSDAALHDQSRHGVMRAGTANLEDGDGSDLPCATLYTRSPGTSEAIGRAPSGVAMGVSGEAQMHSRHPLGQVPRPGRAGPGVHRAGTLQQS
jgi:hypothetical protein